MLPRCEMGPSQQLDLLSTAQYCRYENWVYFFLSEIDKTSREALCYWFAVADINMSTFVEQNHVLR